jgi:hypothetical protein
MMTQSELRTSGVLARACEARRSRADVRATVAMLGLFGLGLGALVVYTHSFMSMPAEIGLERHIELSQPCSHERQSPSAADARAAVNAHARARAQGPYPR